MKQTIAIPLLPLFAAASIASGCSAPAPDSPPSAAPTASSSTAPPSPPGSGGAAPSTNVSPSTTPPPPPPPDPPHQITVGDQTAWYHDDGFSAGYFHTYDGLKVAGPADQPRKVHVFLPRDYESSDARYPVVYMNDGDTAFWPGGAANKTWDVAGALATLYAEGSIPKVLIVAIVPIQREREYTHVAWAPGRECCGLDGYTGYVADAVKGFVDQSYRTTPEPRRTAIVGSSHGGLAAFYMASRRPDRFGLAGCLSSSFWAGVSGDLASSELIQRTQGTLANASTRPRLWIDWGLVRTGGLHNSVIEEMATSRGREMAALLRDRFGYGPDELFVQEDPIGEHDEDSWRRRFPDVMRSLFHP